MMKTTIIGPLGDVHSGWKCRTLLRVGWATLLLLVLNSCQTAESPDDEDLGPEIVVQREYAVVVQEEPVTAAKELQEEPVTESNDVEEDSVLESVVETESGNNDVTVVENEAIAELTGDIAAADSSESERQKSFVATESPKTPDSKDTGVIPDATGFSSGAEIAGPVGNGLGDEPLVEELVADSEEVSREGGFKESGGSPPEEVAQQSVVTNVADGVVPPPPVQVPAINMSRLDWIGYEYRARDGKLIVELKTKGSPRYNIFQEVNRSGQPELVIRLFDTRLRKSMRRPVDASEFRSPVSYIRTRNSPKAARVDVLLTLRESAQPHLTTVPGALKLTYDIPAHWYGIKKQDSVASSRSAEMAEPLAAANLYPTFDSGSRTPEMIDANTGSTGSNDSPAPPSSNDNGSDLDDANQMDRDGSESDRAGSWQGFLPVQKFRFASHKKGIRTTFAGGAWQVGQDNGFGGNVGSAAAGFDSNSAMNASPDVATLPGGPTNTVVGGNGYANSATEVAPVSASNSQSNQAEIAAIAAGRDLVGADDGQSPPVNSNKLIDLDFRGAPLSQVIKAITEKSGVNFIYAGTVATIPVTIRLDRIPWDLAFKSILDLNGLGLVRIASTLYRVDLMANIAREREALDAARIAAQRLEPTKIIFLRLSYAQASEVAGLVGEMLQNAIQRDPRIQIRAEQRTNSLILEAPERELARVKSLVARIDLQTPQVKIESRVVEVGKSTNSNFGIAWRGPFNFDQGTGLGMGSVPFPNFVRSTYAIDPGGASGVGSFNVFFGSINNTFNLDLAIGMSEKDGLTETLQTNTVYVQNNQSASLTGGQSDIFVVPGSAAGSAPGTQTIDYTLSVNVTPSVTADGAVRMTVNISSSSPAASLANGASGGRYSRSINTVLLKRSGETAVIGGLNTREKESSWTGIPVLSSIPIVGALFRSNQKKLATRELLLMVTPTIMNVAQATGEDSGVVFESDPGDAASGSPEGLENTATSSEFRRDDDDAFSDKSVGSTGDLESRNDNLAGKNANTGYDNNDNGNLDNRALEEALNNAVNESDFENKSEKRATNNVLNRVGIDENASRDEMSNNGTVSNSDDIIDDADDFLED